MKKYEKIIFCRVIPILLMLLFLVLPVIGNAWTISDDLPSAETTDISDTAGRIVGSVRGAIEAIAEGLMISMLVYIGIKIVTSAPEGRAEYKKMLLPYAIGVIIIKFAPQIIGVIESVGKGNTGAATTFVNPYVNAFKDTVEYVGKALAVIILIIIGIKYIMAAPEGKAEYRKTMVPYVIGSVLIYTASTLAPKIVAHQYQSIVSAHLSPLQGAVSVAGEFLAIIMLIVIGIKYMTSAPEGKAEYRKIMIPYLVGAIIVFTTAFGSNAIIGTIKTQAGVAGGNGQTYQSETQKVLSTVLGVVRYAGVGMAIIMLIVLAIKYMTTAPEGKAEVTKTMVPYFIGAVVLFAAGTFVGIIKTFAEGI